jgi:hypothetical protein
MKTKVLISLLVISSSLTACADRKNLSPLPTVSDEAKSNMAAPINCDTAEEDIAVLEEEKAGVGKRMLSGVRSVLPIAAAAGILLGDYRGRVEVATGKYNSDLEAKINEIRTSCGL